MISPDVSFIVPALNVAAYIGAAVQSALDQRDVTVEVIVVDDGSSDGTEAVVGEIARRDHRVILLRNETRQGVAAARNRAMDRMSGTWMALLDGDDLLRPERSRALIDLATAAGVDLIADNFERFETDDEPAGTTMIRREAMPYAFLVDAADFMRANLTFNKRSISLGAIKPMIRSEVIRSHGVRYRSDVPVGEDYHFCLDLLLGGLPLLVTSESYYRYRMRAGSASWRIDGEHIERLLVAHRSMGLESRFSADQRLLDAAHAYEAALLRAQRLMLMVDQLKRRRIASALGCLARDPAIWPLVAQVGREMAGRRLGLRSGMAAQA